MLRFQVDIIVQIEIQRGFSPLEQYLQPAEETTDWLIGSRRVMNLMILGIRILLLMRQSTSTTTTTPTT